MTHWSSHLINAHTAATTLPPLERDLRKLLPDPTGTPAEIAARLRQHISAEHRRGLARHWAYDRNRHAALNALLNQLKEGI